MMFVFSLALSGYYAFLFMSGYISVPPLLVALGAVSVNAGQIFSFRWSALLFRGMFLVLFLSAICVGLWVLR
jgi:hypothetical protein